MKDTTYTESMFLYFPEGIPGGHSIISAGFELEPKLTQISPNEGSAGGSKISATVYGVGEGTADVELVNDQGESICSSLEIVSYSNIECLTLAEDMPEG